MTIEGRWVGELPEMFGRLRYRSNLFYALVCFDLDSSHLLIIYQDLVSEH
jgi:hypothetical protein